MGLEEQDGKHQVQTSPRHRKVEGCGRNEVDLGWGEGSYKSVEMIK